jgi:hypothetical protein
MGRMLRPNTLRALGADRLAALFRARPDLLEPAPPTSLQDLAARLTNPVSLSLALRGFDAPTAQAAEGLAALGEAADREPLERLLGIAPGGAGDVAREGLDHALDVLRQHLFLNPSDTRVRLLPEICNAWPEPLGLGPSAAQLVTPQTADAIRHALRQLGVATKVSLKADLVRVLVGVLTDPDRVRAIAESAPDHVRERLRRAALGETQLTRYTYYSYRFSGGSRRGPIDPADWALDRMLGVQTYRGRVVMPAEVALALRGTGWTAPFTPQPPSINWHRRPDHLLDREMAAAASHAVRVVTTLLETASAHPLALLKDGRVGVRELRRVGKALGVPVREVRLGLAVAQAAGLLGTSSPGAAPTPDVDAWLAAEPAERAAYLARAWLDLPALPLLDPEASWVPESRPSICIIKQVAFRELAAHPQQAAEAEELPAWLAWERPLALGGSISNLASGTSGAGAIFEDDLDDLDELDAGPDDDLDEEPTPAERARELVPALFEEAAWLGLVVAGALTPAGRAAQAGEDVAAVFGDTIGTARRTVRIQADLTAVVLGQPSAELSATLDRAADRESRSSAATWRFGPASVRRALDAGLSAEQLVKELTTAAEGELPQPLEYLIGDVARQHGLIRGAAVQCYLRGPEALLREVAADRRLRALDLRLVAPSVLVGEKPLAETLAALRSAGHAPVEEGRDGEAVLVPQRSHRTPSPRQGIGRAQPAPGSLSRGRGMRRPAAAAESVAAALVR